MRLFLISIFFVLTGFLRAQTITYSGSLTLCPGATKILTATGAPGGATYQWRKDGTDIPSAISATYAATATGSYDVTVTASSTSATYTPVVLSAGANPVVDFTFSPSGDCANSPTTFTNSTTGNAPTYVWNFGDPNSGSANTSTTANPVRGFTGTPGNGTQDFSVLLTATDADGCVASKTKTVQKKQIPSTLIDETNGSKMYDNHTYFTNCSGASSLFTFYNTPNTTKGSNTNYQISWGNGNPDYNNAAFSTSGITQTYAPGTYTLHYTVTGDNACSASADYYVFVGSNPAVTFGTPGNTSVCTGDNLTFPIGGTAGNPPSTIYTVSVDDGTPDIVYTNATLPASVTHTFLTSSCGKPLNNGYVNSFYASMKAENACSSSLIPVYPIYVSQKPTAAFTASNTNVCVNSSVSFNSSPTTNTNNLNGTCTLGKVVWIISPAAGFVVSGGAISLGDDNSGSTAVASWTPGATSISVQFTAPGTYTIKLKAGNNTCGIDETTKTVCVSATPTASFTVDQNTGCSNLAVATTNTSSAATCGTNTYSWTVGYSATSGCTPSTSNYTYASGNASSANPQFNFINPGTYTIGLVNTVTGGCSSPSATQTITVKSKPIVNISASSSMCAGNTSPSASVATCSGTISAYTWTLAGATPATANTLSPGVINYATPGSYTIALDVTNECGVTSASKSITIKAVPDVTVPANQVKCAGTASGSLSFSGSLPGTSYTWTNDATGIGLGGSGSGSSIPSFTLANSTTSPIVSTISVVPSVSGCAGPAGTFSITVNPKPSVPTVTSPLNYCQNSVAAPLTATPTGGNSLLWYNNPGLTGGSSAAPTPSTATSGTTNYYVTQENAYNCLSNAANIAVSVTAAIVGNSITSDQTICSGVSATALTGAALSGGTNSFTYQWESSPDGVSWANASGAATGAGYSPGAITATRYYRRKVSSGACSQDISNVVVITVQPGLSGTAITANQSICQGTIPAQLSGSTVTGATGSYTYAWESSLNGSSWSSLGAASADYQPTAPTVTTLYRRTVTSGSCSAVSSVTVTVTPTVGNATIGSAQTICTGSTASVLSGAAPTGGNGAFSYQWQSSPDGSSWTNASGASTGSSYAPGAITATTYYRRNASSGSCIAVPSNSIIITVLPALTNTGISSDQAICENNPTALLHGALPTGGNGTYTYAWESSANNTTWTSITGSNTQDYTPPALHTTTFYRRTVSSGACTTISSSVKITIYNTPTTGTLSQAAVNTCYGSDVTLYTSGFVGTIKTWQTNATPSNTSSWVDVPASTGNSVTFTGVQNSFAVRVIVQQDGGCGNEVASTPIPVTVSIPTVPGITVSDATVCINSNNGTVNLSGQTGNVVRWEASTNNGGSWNTISNTITSYTYHNLTTTTLFRAVVQSGFCSQQPSTSTRITVVPNLTPSNAGTDQALCAQAGITLNGNNPAVGTGMWTQTGGPAATITNPLLSNSTITGIQNGQVYKFTWTITGPGCPSSADEVQIVNTPPITVANAGPDQLVCSFVGPTESVILAGNTPANPAFETGTWSLVSVTPAGTSPAIANTHTSNSSFSFSRAGAYTLAWTISNGACSSTNDQVVIHVFDKPVSGPLTPSATVGCIGNDIIVTTGNTLKGVISKWQYNFTTLLSQTWTDTAVTNNSIVFTNVQRSFNVRMITISAGAAMGCSIADTSAVPVEIIPDFSNDIDTTPLSVCPGQSISIAGQLPSGAYNVFAYQWQQSKDGKTGWTDIPGQTFTNLNMIPLATSYVRRMVIVSPCSKASIPVYIFVRPSAGNFLMSDSVGTCFPFDVTFTNLVLPSTVTTWNFGDGAFNEGDVITHTYQSTGTFQVVMTAQYPGGCKFEATKQVTITGPKGILKYDLQSVCTGKQVYFEAASAGIDSVRWNFGDGTSLVTRSQTIFHSYQQAGPYVPYAELLAGPGGKCRTRLNGLDTVFVDQITAGFSHTLVQECGATRAAFSDTSRAFYGIASHQWEFGDGTYSSEINPAHTYLGANTWNVREIVIAKGGCRDTAGVPVPVSIWNIPQAKTNLDSIACVGQTVPYKASVFSKDAIRSTVWNFSNGPVMNTQDAPKIFDFPGNYLTVFIATTVNGCADTVMLPITVYPKLSIELGPDRILPTGYKLRLTSTITNGPVVKWQWTPPTYLDCPTCSEPEATVKKDITYRAVAVTAHGCEATDTIAIKPICEDAQLFIPNVFSPDGDGINDVLMVRGQGIRLVKSFRIFNRWGAIVFERSNFSPNDKANGWDGRIAGKPVAPDVYVYTCEAVCENDISFQRHGNITVIKNKQ